jgi:hypothetical protein
MCGPAMKNVVQRPKPFHVSILGIFLKILNAIFRFKILSFISMIIIYKKILYAFSELRKKEKRFM